MGNGTMAAIAWSCKAGVQLSEGGENIDAYQEKRSTRNSLLIILTTSKNVIRTDSTPSRQIYTSRLRNTDGQVRPWRESKSSVAF